LKGAHRHGHFQGVCQVVHKLLDIVQPHQMFLGQKDYQQCMVLKQLVNSLKLPVEIIIGETLRESSSLAMSSRNLRLSAEERQKAAAIYQALLSIKQNINSSEH
jgi:pantoate--beta-alanine ligase